MRQWEKRGRDRVRSEQRWREMRDRGRKGDRERREREGRQSDGGYRG